MKLRVSSLAYFGAVVAVIAVAYPAGGSGHALGGRILTPRGLGLSFRLEEGWTSRQGQNGWDWEALSPSRVAFIRIKAAFTALSFRKFTSVLSAEERATISRADAHATFSVKTTMVASVPAEQFIARYHASGTSFALVVVAFKHRNLAYALEFDTHAKLIANERPVFEQLIMSLHFVHSS